MKTTAPPYLADLSVVIPTFNEEGNLKDCLESLKGWAREVYVVDSFSNDHTVDIALSYASQGVRVVQHPYENYAAQWRWALSTLPLKGSWIFNLDADERPTPEFKAETEAFLKNPGEVEGVYFKRVMVFMGSPLRHGGAANVDLRLWKNGKGSFEAREVNPHAVVKGPTAHFKSTVLHYNNSKSLSEWLDKHNQYSSWEAREILKGDVNEGWKPRLFGGAVERKRWLRKIYWSMPFRHFFHFLLAYSLRGGFLDGKAGFRYAFLRTSYFYWVDLKVAEARSTGMEPLVVRPARGKPHPKLAAVPKPRKTATPDRV